MAEKTPAAKAATAYNRICELTFKRDAEIKAAPTEIATKYEDKIARVMSDCDDETKAILVRMLG
jgi:hypothetical protein